MGVTAHFFAFDPCVYTVPPTMDRWLEWGELDREMEIVGKAKAWLRELPSPLGDNKRWYDNLAGEFAWTCARRHVDEPARAALDRWFSHLFWESAEHGCSCARQPETVAEDQVIYDRALIDHILSLAHPLEVLEPALAAEFQGDPPKTEPLHESWIYEMDGFASLVDRWQALFRAAAKAGPGWSLFRWVWY
jgi:hypothetical protein